MRHFIKQSKNGLNPAGKGDNPPRLAEINESSVNKDKSVGKGNKSVENRNIPPQASDVPPKNPPGSKPKPTLNRNVPPEASDVPSKNPSGSKPKPTLNRNIPPEAPDVPPKNPSGSKPKPTLDRNIPPDASNVPPKNPSGSKPKSTFKSALKAALKAALLATGATAAALFITAVVLINILFPFKYSQSVNTYSKKYGVDSRLVYAVIWTESKFDAGAKSRAGAAGLMQLMPSTAEWCAGRLSEQYSPQRLSEPDFNIKLGTYYLAYLIGKYGETDALAAYNAGEGNLLEWDGEIKFKETKTYIKRVKSARFIYDFKSR